MQKIKDEFIKRLYRLDIQSKFTFATMLELIGIANEQGEAEVYYKDMVDKLGCTNSTFYEVVHELEDMGFIKIRNKKDCEFKSDMYITICGNSFKTEEDYKNYIDTNSVFFADGLYKKLSAGAIKVYLYSMFRVLKAGEKSNHGEDYIRKERNKLRYAKSTSCAKIAIQIGLCPFNTKPKNVPKKYIRAVKKYIKEPIVFSSTTSIQISKDGTSPLKCAFLTDSKTPLLI